MATRYRFLERQRDNAEAFLDSLDPEHCAHVSLVRTTGKGDSSVTKWSFTTIQERGAVAILEEAAAHAESGGRFILRAYYGKHRVEVTEGDQTRMVSRNRPAPTAHLDTVKDVGEPEAPEGGSSVAAKELARANTRMLDMASDSVGTLIERQATGADKTLELVNQLWRQKEESVERLNIAGLEAAVAVTKLRADVEALETRKPDEDPMAGMMKMMLFMNVMQILLPTAARTADAFRLTALAKVGMLEGVDKAEIRALLLGKKKEDQGPQAQMMNMMMNMMMMKMMRDMMGDDAEGFMSMMGGSSKPSVGAASKVETPPASSAAQTEANARAGALLARMRGE